MIGKKIVEDLTITQDKYGNPCTDGHTEKVDRYHMLLNYDNGKTGIYDFAIANYWSPIRANFFLAQGNLVSINLGDDILYQNELLKTKGVGKNIGICHMLLNMKKYLETGECPYSFARAMTDTYITQMFLEAGEKPFTPIRSKKLPWE